MTFEISFLPLSVPSRALAIGWLPLLAAGPLEAADVLAADAGEIVVTGQREGLRVPSTAASRLPLTALETPAAVALLSGDDLREFGYTSLIDAQTRAPGISSVPFPGNGNNSLSARGFYGTTSVTQVYDGIQFFNTSVVAYPFDTWNVDRIEFLNGPASTLYGTGFIGGAVNIVPLKADPARFSARARAAYGSFNTNQFAGDVNVPLSPTLAFRANASWRNSTGFVERGDSSSIAASASLRWQPTPALTLTLSNDFGQIDPSTYEGTPTFNGRVIAALARENYNVADAAIRFRENRLFLRAEWARSDTFSLSAAGYHLDHFRMYREVFTFAYVPATDSVRRTQYRDIETFQHQVGGQAFATIRTAPGALRNELVVGAEANRSFNDRRDNTLPGGGSPQVGDLVSARDPAVGTFFPRGTPARPVNEVTLRQWAAFAQNRLRLGERLSLIGALRYDEYRTRRDDLVARTLTFGEQSGLTWSAGAVFQPTPDVSIYAQHAVATDPPTQLASIGAAQQLFDLSTGRQWEAGVKASVLDGRVEATLAGYHITKNNLLTPIFGTNLSEQVGRQSSRGAEATLLLRPVDSLFIDANAAYVDARFDEFNSRVGGVTRSLAGFRPQFIPEVTANLRARWAFAPGWRVRGGVQGVSSRFSDNANTARLPGYVLVEAGLNHALTERIDIDVRVENAFDRLYAASTYAGNTTQILVGPPRSVGAALNMRW